MSFPVSFVHFFSQLRPIVVGDPNAHVQDVAEIF